MMLPMDLKQALLKLSELNIKVKEEMIILSFIDVPLASLQPAKGIFKPLIVKFFLKRFIIGGV